MSSRRGRDDKEPKSKADCSSFTIDGDQTHMRGFVPCSKYFVQLLTEKRNHSGTDWGKETEGRRDMEMQRVFWWCHVIFTLTKDDEWARTHAEIERAVRAKQVLMLCLKWSSREEGEPCSNTLFHLFTCLSVLLPPQSCVCRIYGCWKLAHLRAELLFANSTQSHLWHYVGEVISMFPPTSCIPLSLSLNQLSHSLHIQFATPHSSALSSSISFTYN